MSVTFDDVGTITVHTDPPVVLPRPKYGAYRALRDQFRAARQILNDSAAKIEGLPPEASSEEIQEAVSEADHFMKVVFPELRIAWLRDVAKLLDVALPDDVDEWPADMVEDATLPGKMLAHWRTVPLAHGGQVNNSRSKTGNG